MKRILKRCCCCWCCCLLGANILQAFLLWAVAAATAATEKITSEIGKDFVGLRGAHLQQQQKSNEKVLGKLRTLADWLGANPKWIPLFLHSEFFIGGASLQRLEPAKDFCRKKRKHLFSKNFWVALFSRRCFLSRSDEILVSIVVVASNKRKRKVK